MTEGDCGLEMTCEPTMLPVTPTSELVTAMGDCSQGSPKSSSNAENSFPTMPMTNYSNGNVKSGFDRLLISGNGGSSLVEQAAPKQELHEQPNGQFQITENGALNLMKAESMDMLVVNNLAQDLSVAREHSVSIQKEELVASNFLPESVDEIYQTQRQEHSPQQAETETNAVPNCLSNDGNSVGMTESLPPNFLSSLEQTNSSNMPFIDNLCTTVFTVPEVEVLTSNVSNIGGFQEKLMISSTSHSSQENPPTEYSIEQGRNIQGVDTVTASGESSTFENIFRDAGAATKTKSPDVKMSQPQESLPCQWKDCSATFDVAEGLINHVNISHVRCEGGEEYKCYWLNCPRKGKGFNARYKMLIHVRTHTNEKPHVCCICQKSFSRLENLKIHTRTHSGEKPYVCPVPNCNKAYANSSDRFKHVRAHKEHKPFACKVPNCGKRYTDPSSLRKHMKNRGHKVVGSELIPLTPNTEVKTLTNVPSSYNEHTRSQQENNPQSTVVTLMPNGPSNQNSATHVITINGSMFQISNLVSNPLLSSTIVSPQGKQSIATQTDSSSDNSLSSDSGINRDSDDLLKDIGVKESLSLETETQCLIVTTEERKSQDSPLDLSTCTSFQQSETTSDSRNVNASSLGVKLMSLGCVVLNNT